MYDVSSCQISFFLNTQNQEVILCKRIQQGIFPNTVCISRTGNANLETLKCIGKKSAGIAYHGKVDQHQLLSSGHKF